MMFRSLSPSAALPQRGCVGEPTQPRSLPRGSEAGSRGDPHAILLRAKSPRMGSALGLAAVSLVLMAGTALAQTPTPETPAAAAAVLKANPGDTAWMLISSVLVLMM